MIQDFRDTTSENPIAQIWKMLRIFLDVDFVSDRIRTGRQVPKGRFVGDVRKQARQVAYSVRQAEEYFHASSQVGLATRPLLLYYGAMSLSRALVLVSQDGTYSLDALRKAQKHNHHGLELHKGKAEAAGRAPDAESFLRSIECKVFAKDGLPWGQFAIFYQSLVPSAFGLQVEVHDRDAVLQSTLCQVCADLLPLDSLVSRSLNLLDLAKSLPDVHSPLEDLGIQTDLCRGSLVTEMHRHHAKDGTLEKTRWKLQFLIDGIAAEQKSRLLAFYRENNPALALGADLGTNVALQWSGESRPSDTKMEYFPDIVDDINGRKFYILEPQSYVPEPAAYYSLLFCLGMLSRYYPDVWMRAIERVQIAELTDSLLNFAYRKYPNLMLDQMTRVKHYVHL